MADTTDATNEAAAQTLLQRAWFRLEGVVQRLQDFVGKMNTPETGTQVAREAVQGTDNSVNGSESAHVNINRIVVKVDANALAIIALLVAVVAIVMVFSQSQIVDAKVIAGAAKAEATAQAANTNARVAVDEIERIRTALAAQSIVIPKGHD